MAWHEYENGITAKEEEPEPVAPAEPIPTPNSTGSADAWRRARIVLGL